MRDINVNFATHLATGATTICRLWLIKREDGLELGFTDHDRSLEIDGITYVASSGMDAQAVQTTGGLAVNNSAAIGALTSSGISEADISIGKYDNAEVFHWLVNWQDPDQRLLQFRGFLGDIKRQDGVFEVELRGLTEKLNQPNGRNYARYCGHKLGDTKCGVDVNDPAFLGNASISAVSGRDLITVTGLGSFDDGWFSAGSLTWETGANEGLKSVINLDHMCNGLRLLSLWEETRYPISVGDSLSVNAGCNRSGSTCSSKFGNLLNFGGFPYLPGEDWSVAYPVRTNDLSGQSLFDGLGDE